VGWRCKCAAGESSKEGAGFYRPRWSRSTVLREWKPLGTASGAPRRRCRLSLVVWSRRSCACCNGWGDVVFSLGAIGFGRGQGTLGLARAGRGARKVALTVPCRVVCGAREKEPCVLRNATAILSV
jgi:hypothetical protein